MVHGHFHGNLSPTNVLVHSPLCGLGREESTVPSPSSHPSTHGRIIRFTSHVFGIFLRLFGDPKTDARPRINLRTVKARQSLTVSRNGTPLTPELVVNQLRPIADQVLRTHVRNLGRAVQPSYYLSAPGNSLRRDFSCWVGMSRRFRGDIQVNVDPVGSTATLTASGVVAELVLGVYADTLSG